MNGIVIRNTSILHKVKYFYEARVLRRQQQRSKFRVTTGGELCLLGEGSRQDMYVSQLRIFHPQEDDA